LGLRSIDALAGLCADQGETLEERDVKHGRPAGYSRELLSPPDALQINRNLRLILLELDFPVDDFIQKMETRG
jgi:hypothetical protein